MRWVIDYNAYSDIAGDTEASVDRGRTSPKVDEALPRCGVPTGDGAKSEWGCINYYWDRNSCVISFSKDYRAGERFGRE